MMIMRVLMLRMIVNTRFASFTQEHKFKKAHVKAETKQMVVSKYSLTLMLFGG